MTSTAKSIKSVRSIRSVRSVKSIRSTFGDDDEEDYTERVVFEDQLPDICNRFNCPYAVSVKKEIQRDNALKMFKTETKAKYRKITMAAGRNQSDTFAFPDAGTSLASIPQVDESTILITAFYDQMNRLAEIFITRAQKVPRILMQTIGLLAPLYDELTKITISKSGIDIYTIHELKKMLPMTKITDVCLDESTLREGNYAILLENVTNLKNLSLCRCKINDVVCKQIFSHLHMDGAAEKHLFLLNLSSNQITDVGAGYIGEALRTNRHLRYLNLADNRLNDEGASLIFNSMTEFPLTLDELMAKRKIHIEYLQKRMAIYLSCLKDLEEASVSDIQSLGNAKRGRKKKGTSAISLKTSSKATKASTMPSTNSNHPHNETLLRAKAQALTADRIGVFEHPYNSQNVRSRNGWIYCHGNNILNYLNLAYNNLSYLSIQNLLNLVTYQNKTLKLNETGLMKVVIDGNYLPNSCSEMDAIQTILNRNVTRHGGRPIDSGRRKSRVSHMRISLTPETAKRVKESAAKIKREATP